MSPLRSSLVLVLLLLTGVALAGVPRLVGRRGWAPLVAATGASTPSEAVPALREGADLVRAIAGGLEIEPATADLLGELRGSLESFALSDLHALLPEQSHGDRRLRLSGRRDGRRYQLCRAPAAQPAALAPRSALGDLALTVTARPLALAGDASRYLLALGADLGAGPFGWDRLVAGGAAAARLLGSGDPRACARAPERPHVETRLAVVRDHPRLRAEDVEPLAVLREALPALSEALLEVGRVEDVLVLDLKGDGSVRQLRLAGHLRPDLLERRAPDLAEYLRDLGPLLHAEAVWRDEAGRRLARLVLDTDELRLAVDAFVSANGALVPIEDGRPRLDLVEPPADGARTFTCELDVRSRLGGLEARVRGLRFDCTLSRSTLAGEERVDLVGRAAAVPAVSVSGRALGILPAWAVDLVIPGDLPGLIRGFFEVACGTDAGQGALLALRGRQAAAGGATLGLEARGEVPDSALIRLGARIASVRLLPDPETRAELFALVLRLQAAFREDLRRYEGLEGE